MRVASVIMKAAVRGIGGGATGSALLPWAKDPGSNPPKIQKIFPEPKKLIYTTTKGSGNLTLHC